MTETKLETAKKMAKAHYAVEPNLRQIFLLEPLNEQDPNEPIKLLEVVDGTFERGIEPIAFTPDPGRGIAYPSLIVEVSPREYKGIRSDKAKFEARGWRVGIELTR